MQFKISCNNAVLLLDMVLFSNKLNNFTIWDYPDFNLAAEVLKLNETYNEIIVPEDLFKLVVLLLID